MPFMLINASQEREMRVAIVENNKLLDFDNEFLTQLQKKSYIYKGKVTAVEPSLNAVFVDYGSERHGFLPVKEIAPNYLSAPTDDDDTASSSHAAIEKIKVGQELIVQIEKEERGSKGAALTSFISLAGAYLVLMPNNPRAGGISRRIPDEERNDVRELLSQLSLPEGMGVIVRTAGVGKSLNQIQWDLDILIRHWHAIEQATQDKPAPYLIHAESDVVIRTIRDNLRENIEEIVIDDDDAFKRVKEYLTIVRPDFADRVKKYSKDEPIFSQYNIERQIEEAHQREVQLPSGGALVIDHTEALVSIDVNSARATKGSNIEETALQTNVEAADEVTRQLR